MYINAEDNDGFLLSIYKNVILSWTKDGSFILSSTFIS